MTAARLAARCVELLGAVEGPVAVMAPSRVTAEIAARVDVASGNGAAGGAVCVFLGERLDTTSRGATLEALAACMRRGAFLVVADHNQPRGRWRRLVALLVLALHGHGPARARHLVAREMHHHGFAIERLRLEDGERVQLVLARRRDG